MATLNTNTTTSLTHGMATYYDKLALSILTPMLHFDKLAVSKELPRNSGKIVSFYRYTRMVGNVTPITEGTVPNGVALSSSVVTATVAPYGDYTVVEQLLNLTTIDPIIQNATKLMTHRAADTIDLLIRNACTAGGTTNYTGAVTALTGIAATSVIKMVDIRKIRRNFRSNNVPTFSDGSYRGIIHPYQAYDLMSATAAGEWTDLHKYVDAGVKRIDDSEIGKAENIRFLESTNVGTTTTGTSASATAYTAVFAGDDAVAMISLSGGAGKPQIDVLKPRQAGINDPLGQFWTVAYKIEAFTAKVLEAVRVQLLVSGATQ